MPRKRTMLSESQTNALSQGSPSGIKHQEKPSGTLLEKQSKLDQVAARIEKEKELAAAQKLIKDKKDEATIAAPVQENPPPPAMGGFVPDPMLVTIGGGLVFGLMKIAANVFKKDLYPLKPEQKKRLETYLDKMARKYIPADWSKHQENAEGVLILGGIVAENLTDIKKPVSPATKTEPEQKAPAIPAVPETKVTVVTAEAPPVPEGVR